MQTAAMQTFRNNVMMKGRGENFTVEKEEAGRKEAKA
jgi:hypothetical protein